MSDPALPVLWLIRIACSLHFRPVGGVPFSILLEGGMLFRRETDQKGVAVLYMRRYLSWFQSFMSVHGSLY